MSKKMSLARFMAKACYYAQQHIDDPDAWPVDGDAREYLLQCTSFQMACFFAQNTRDGYGGVDWCIVIGELVEHPMKTEQQWYRIIDRIAKELGGWI